MKGEVIEWGLPDNEKKYPYLHLFDDVKVAPTLCIFTIDPPVQKRGGMSAERIIFDLKTSEISEVADWIKDNIS